MIFEMKLLSSLVKVYTDAPPDGADYREDFALRGECVAFQVAYRTDVPIASITAEAVSALPGFTVRQVEDVPVRWLGFQIDEDVERRTVGLYPDVLRTPDADHPIRSVTRVWRSVWVSGRIAADQPAGTYPLQVKFTMQSPDFTREFTSPSLSLEVLALSLPPQTLRHTEWLHVDCLAQYYRLPVWCEELWEVVGNYMRNAAAHGLTMIYTPLFTPPLDTRVGHERLTVQLIGVEREEGGLYRFDFSLLRRWIELARACGMHYFEFSHLFTQWGAKACPKIMGRQNGVTQQLFGWDTPADSADYRAFLDAFLPALRGELETLGIAEASYFHISDEPHAEHVESYARAAETVRRHLGGLKLLDALSDVDFYRKGLVDIPVPATDYFAPFDGLALPERWTYYCCCEVNQVSNRLLHFPSSRNRIMGILLYAYRIQGFLQWGFNYWMTNLSRFALNPYEDVCADFSLPPGDAFMVYPGADGHPVDSIHYEVFCAGIQDMSLLELLESKIGREAVDRMLLEWSGRPLTMLDFPREEAALLDFRKRIGARLRAIANEEAQC